MAKKKYKGSSFSSKSFFNIVVLSASALGLIIAVFAVQNRTETRSNASGAQCGRNPILSEIRADGYPKGYARSVEYKMRIKNVDDSNEGGDCANDSYKISFNLPNDNWKANVLNNADDVITLSEGDSKTFIVKVRRPDGINNGRRNITVRAVNERLRKDGTRAKDTEIIGYYVTGNTAGNNDKRTNAPVETEDDTDSKNCTSNPKVTMLSSKLSQNSNGENPLPDWGNVYKVYAKIKNNCDTTQSYKLNISDSNGVRGTWRFLSTDQIETPLTVKLKAGQEFYPTIEVSVEKFKNYSMTLIMSGKFQNADLINKDSIKVQSDGSGYR